MNRRNFLKLLGIGAVGAAVGRVAPAKPAPSPQDLGEWIKKNPSMQGVVSSAGFTTAAPKVNFISRYRYEPLTKIPDDITFFTRPENRPPTHHA